MKQRDTLSPTILNVVVDVVFRHWFLIVMEEAVVSEVFEMAIQRMADFFYVDDVSRLDPVGF